MKEQFLFDFRTDVSRIQIPSELNNPFGTFIPELARIAAQEFQEFITTESEEWGTSLLNQRGKMFGVLVVQKEEGGLGFLGTASGKLPGNHSCSRFVPSVFDDSIDDFFINRGMTELTEIGKRIEKSDDQTEVELLKEDRKQKSLALQKRLFENYNFLNLLGDEKSVTQIFDSSTHGNPPAAAGECAAPKLLNYAFEQSLKPIAIAEFWWGKEFKNKEREHKSFYPSCKNKCRPILEFMLDDNGLFERGSAPDIV